MLGIDSPVTLYSTHLYREIWVGEADGVNWAYGVGNKNACRMSLCWCREKQPERLSFFFKLSLILKFATY